MKNKSRVIVVDTFKGTTLDHGIYSIMYLPSWLRIKNNFKWYSSMDVLRSTEKMKEYYFSAEGLERPYRAQRIVFVIRSLQLYGYKKTGQPRFEVVPRQLLVDVFSECKRYLITSPVVAWDWVVSWTESRAMAEAYPEEYIAMYRRLRSKYDTKRKPKPELAYFIQMLREVAQINKLDLEYKI